MAAQIFEAIGLSQDVIDRYFTNTVTRVGGIGLKEIEEIVNQNHNKAFDPAGAGRGHRRWTASVTTSPVRVSTQRITSITPPPSICFSARLRPATIELFKQYTALVDDENKPHTLRGLLDFRFAEDGGVPIDEVESVDSIVKRFKTGAMSYGSISQEAHECLAVAMNHLGGKSNTGEGGEKPGASARPGAQLRRSSRWPPAASASPASIWSSANEIQIKMAQGAKPGEGGHLPAQKVYPWIAKTRYSTPGVSLISPAAAPRYLLH